MGTALGPASKIRLKSRKFTDRLDFFSSSLLKPHPLAQQIAIRSLRTERAALLCLFYHTKLWEKVPGHLLSSRRLRKRAAIEALRLISVACLLSIFSSPAHRDIVRQSSYLPGCSHSYSRAGDHMDEDMSPRSGCLGRVCCIPRRGVVR